MISRPFTSGPFTYYNLETFSELQKAIKYVALDFLKINLRVLLLASDFTPDQIALCVVFLGKKSEDPPKKRLNLLLSRYAA